MIHLPLYIEKKLKELFPRQRDRDQFVGDLVKEAFETMDDENLTKADRKNQMVGGTLHLFTDGGSRGNPGQAAIGVILEDPATGKVIKELSQTIGIQTNNVAEYQALIDGLKLADNYHPNVLVCHLDSELVVKQLNGQYKVKMPALKEYFNQIQELADKFVKIEFVHIPRADNFRADALVNQALDAAGVPKYNRIA